MQSSFKNLDLKALALMNMPSKIISRQLSYNYFKLAYLPNFMIESTIQRDKYSETNKLVIIRM